MVNNTTGPVLTTSELADTLNDFHNMVLENIANGDALESLLLVAEHGQRLARTRRAHKPQQAVSLMLNVVASNLKELLDLVPKTHQHEFLSEFQNAISDVIKQAADRRS